MLVCKLTAPESQPVPVLHCSALPLISIKLQDAGKMLLIPVHHPTHTHLEDGLIDSPVVCIRSPVMPRTPTLHNLSHDSTEGSGSVCTEQLLTHTHVACSNSGDLGVGGWDLTRLSDQGFT